MEKLYQWRRQDLLRGGAKLLIWSWGTHGELQGQVQHTARWLIVFWLMYYWLKELWVVNICTSWSRRLQNIWIVGSQIWNSRGGARAPVPHSWRRHCLKWVFPDGWNTIWTLAVWGVNTESCSGLVYRGYINSQTFKTCTLLCNSSYMISRNITLLLRFLCVFFYISAFMCVTASTHHHHHHYQE